MAGAWDEKPREEVSCTQALISLLPDCAGDVSGPSLSAV